MATAESTEKRLREWCDTLPQAEAGAAHRATVRLRRRGDGQWDEDRPPAADVDVRRLEELPVLLDEQQRRDLEVIEPLDEGGMADIALADQVPLDREVALKRARAQDDPTADSRDAVTMLLHEAWVTGKLEHPNIVPVYRLGRDKDGAPVIVMKRIEGVTWRGLMDGAPHPGGDAGDPLDQGLDILVEVCQAVEYAHDNGILHRDIKPDNVMVGAFGEVYVLDWGLAVGLDADPESRIPCMSQVSTPAGTPGYMAPEMVADDVGELGVQTDIYLLGAVLYDVLMGAPPHFDETVFEMMMKAWRGNPPEFDDDVPERLAAICRRAMARDPGQRFGSVAEMRRELVDFQRHRESRQMVDRAEGRLIEFHERISAAREAASPKSVDTTELHELFAECRFAFEHALEVDPDNRSAEEGLQSLLSAMASWEIDQGGHEAAAMLVDDLPQRDPELEARLRELREKKESREKEVQELREQRREHDVERGRRARSLFVVKLGLYWTFFASAPFAVEWLFSVSFGSAAYLLQSALLGLFLTAAMYRWRAPLFQNKANQKMVMAAVLTYVLEVFARIVGLQNGLPIQLMLSMEGFMSALGTGVLGVTMDERILWATAVFVVGSFAVGFFPMHTVLINGATTLGAMGALGWAWYPSGDEE